MVVSPMMQEAPAFLENECALQFGLRHILLQSEEELLRKENTELVSEGASVKIKIQVRSRVRMGLAAPTGCTFAYVKSSSSASSSYEEVQDGLGDDLVHDSKGKYCGNAVLQGEKLRSCFIYCEPEHEQVGKIQLFINYSTTQDENSQKNATKERSRRHLSETDEFA